MSHTQFTRDERISLATLLRAGKSRAECGRQLGKDGSAVGREITLNKDDDGSYRGGHAHKRALARRCAAKAPARKIEHDAVLEKHIVSKLKIHWSPEQIAGDLNREAEKTIIVHETIYLWVYATRPDLKKFLRCKKGKYRRKRGTKARESARQKAKVRRIDERPLIVEERSRIGDWEGDTVIGGEKTKRLATNVERKSGYGLADLLHVVTAEIMQQCVIDQFKRIPRNKKHTYTYDNGTELGENDIGLEQRLGMMVYRAYPYHSWERGTNENWNGLLREFFPKGMCFATLTQADVDRAVKLLNHRPRKRLGYLTPHDVFVLGKCPSERKMSVPCNSN